MKRVAIFLRPQKSQNEFVEWLSPTQGREQIGARIQVGTPLNLLQGFGNVQLQNPLFQTPITTFGIQFLRKREKIRISNELILILIVDKVIKTIISGFHCNWHNSHCKFYPKMTPILHERLLETDFLNCHRVWNYDKPQSPPNR